MADKDIQPNYGPAAKTSEGVLDCIYQQPTGNSPQFSNGKEGDIYEEQWKGPYNHLKNIGTGSVFGVQIIIDKKRPSFGGKWISRFDPPALNGAYAWFVSKVSVEEANPSGSHAILKITYIARKSNWGEGMFTDEKQDVWSLSWSTYNVPAVGFCSNGIDPDTGKRKTGKEYDESAFAWKVTHCASYQHEVENDKGNSYVWYENGQRLELNDKEKEVYDKHVNNVCANYHFPVVTRTQTFYLKPTTVWSKVIGSDIDEEHDLDNGCPFKFPTGSKWKFVCVADNVQVTSGGKDDGVKTYVYTKTWWGSKHPDPKFYSPEKDVRWEVGGL